MVTFAPAAPAAFKLMHAGVRALAQVESNGIKVDLNRLAKSKATLRRLIKEHHSKLTADPIWEDWRKQFGAQANLGSRPQLATVLYDVLGYESQGTTSKGRKRTDVQALERLDIPFVKTLLRMEQYKKCLATNLGGIERETTHEGFLHAFFNLHLVSTYRGSSDSPNFQNFPTRDAELARYVRECFVSRWDDGQIVEIDFSGVEVCVSACYHKDPNLIAEIVDPTRDMHRDMACECYLLKPTQVLKTIRHAAKNKFVFPEFYGSYYKDVAVALWDAMALNNLELKNGVLVKDHLAAKGIRKYEDFEAHIAKVEERFWGERFKVYSRWKKSFYDKYQKTGSFQTLTGFRVSGVMRRNEVVNYPIQGSAFHCLLWSLIRIQSEMKRYKFKSKIIGQIHDSLVGDVRVKELDNFLELAVRVMTKDLLKAFPWIIVPMTVEAEVAPVGGTWFDKKGYDVAKSV